MATQKELISKLSPELRAFYETLKGFVSAGNCIADNGLTASRIKSVYLETNTKDDKVRGFVFGF